MHTFAQVGLIRILRLLATSAGAKPLRRIEVCRRQRGLWLSGEVRRPQIPEPAIHSARCRGGLPDLRSRGAIACESTARGRATSDDTLDGGAHSAGVNKAKSVPCALADAMATE